MWIARKLEDVHQDLTRLAEQGKVVGFLANTENAQKITGLVEDIREVMLDYQVCVPVYLFLPCLTFMLTLMLDFSATGYLQQELSAYRESRLFTFCLCGLTGG
jgi:hypothetical protein